MSWSRTLKIRQAIRVQIEGGEEIALLFSDIRGFSTYTARKGDRAAFRLSQVHEEILRERISEHGIPVKSLGDGFMAAFERPLSAIRAAVAIQQDIRERNRRTPDEPIDVGIGISSGTPVMTDIDFIGHSVNVAQRLSGFAKGGQVVVTERIERAVLLPDPLHYIPLGARTFKGVGVERIAEVAWMEEVARISDAKDQLTLILTERGTIVVELAKDSKQELREALESLRTAQADEEGALSALLQRGIARFTRWLIDGSLSSFGIAREQDVSDIELNRRGDLLQVTTKDGLLPVRGVDPTEAERFIAAARRVRTNEATGVSGRGGSTQR